MTLTLLVHSQAWNRLDDYAWAVSKRLGDLRSDRQPGGRRIYVHIGGFGPPGPLQLPQFHYVRNADGTSVHADFLVDEDLLKTYSGYVTRCFPPITSHGVHIVFQASKRSVDQEHFIQETHRIASQLHHAATWQTPNACGAVVSVARADDCTHPLFDPDQLHGLAPKYDAVQLARETQAE